MAKPNKSYKMEISKTIIGKNIEFFNSLKSEKQGKDVLLVVNGKIKFKNQSLTKVIDEFYKIENKENKEISIIPPQRNKSVMVV